MSLSVQKSELLGEGFNGKVYRGVFNYQPVAVKILTNSQRDAQFDREIERLRFLNNVNVVKFLGTAVCDGKPALIMELALGGTLDGALGKQAHSLGWRKSTILQIASGLCYLHQNGVIHRDLKPTNILFKDVQRSRALIADFGLSDDAYYRSYMGAAIFRPSDSQFNSKSDVYCLGVIACCVLVNERARNSTDVSRITEKALRECDERSRTAIRNSLNQLSTYRPTAQQFQEYFRS